MITRSEKSNASQNIGLIDRILRFGIGASMLAGGSLFVIQAGQMHTAMEAATLVMMMLSIYPLMTAVLGVDPFYSLADIRTGGNTGRNQCGTLPYQIRAALGKAPRFCETSDERSLEACHDEPEPHPHHVYWRVDQEPMLYPDDATIEAFAARERKLKLTGK